MLADSMIKMMLGAVVVMTMVMMVVMVLMVMVVMMVMTVMMVILTYILMSAIITMMRTVLLLLMMAVVMMIVMVFMMLGRSVMMGMEPMFVDDDNGDDYGGDDDDSNDNVTVLQCETSILILSDGKINTTYQVDRTTTLYFSKHPFSQASSSWSLHRHLPNPHIHSGGFLNSLYVCLVKYSFKTTREC